MKKIYLLVSLFVFAVFTNLNAQVSLAATSGTLTGTYTTLKAAFDAINIGTHKGDIIIEISASTTEGATPATLLSGDADPTNYSSLTIYPTADGVSVSGNPASGFGVVQLNGADNVIIDGDNPNTVGTNRNLSIVNTAAAATGYTSCLRVSTLAGASASADNIFIFNANFTGNVTAGNASGITSATSSSNTSFGLYFGGKGHATTPTAITSETADAALAGTTINNIVIDNIAVNQCARGIAFNGAATTVGSSLSITNSVIGAAGAISGYPVNAPATTVYTKGIWVAGVDAVFIALNTIQNILSYVSANAAGIELASNIGSGSVNIDDNDITGVLNNGTGGTANGILVSSSGTAFTVSNNVVSNVQARLASTTAPATGITIATTGGIASVIKNKVSTIYNLNTSGFGAVGIHFNSAANGGEISNNFVFDIMNDADAATFGTPSENATGILIGSGSSHKILHNSVRLAGNSTALASNVVSCFTVASAASASLDIRNNIFANTATGGSGSDAHVCMYFPFTSIAASGYVINNNAYYTGPTAGLSGVAFANAASYSLANLYTAGNFNEYSTNPATNFRNWSSGAGFGNNDYASFASTSPAPFVSGTDLHIGAGANRLESGGIATSIATDIDNAGRASFPDIGADEFSGTLQDLTAPLITYTPLSGTCNVGVNQVLTVNIKDVSGVPTSGIGLPVLYFRINAGAYTAVTGVSLGGGNYSFTFGAAAVVPDVVSYYVVAQDGAGTPNVISASSVGAGPFTANPPAATTPPPAPDNYSVQTNLAPGLYLVGAAQPVPFNTLTGAVNRYNTSCLSGAVIFQLDDATYSGAETFPITIGNPQASAANTLTIMPAPTRNPVITGSSTGAIIKFNGADYVTIDGSNNGSTSQNLTITNSNSSTSSAVIWMASASAANGATHNVIKNTLITGNATTTTYAGIVSCSGTAIGTLADAANSFNTYQNVTVHTANRGIALIGAVALDNNDTIINSKIGSVNAAEKIGFRGIYIFNQANVNISNNQVFGITSVQPSRDDVTAGISVRGAISNGIINSNFISDIKNTNTGGWAAHGITLQSTTANTGLSVFNNFVFDIAADGFVSSDPFINLTDNAHGIGILSGGGYRVYYNSINLTTNQTTTGNTAAIFIDNRVAAGSTPSNLNIRNNIFSNQQTTGTRYSIYSFAPASSFSAIDYNDYYTTGTTLGFLGAARTNLAAWQSATGSDANSVSVNPQFTSTTNLHLLGSSTLNNLGIPIVGFTLDIDAATRSITTPDIGADEFTPPNCGGVITAGTIAASTSTICVSGSVSLSSTGFSFGTGMVYRWQSSPDGFTWTNTSETNPSSATFAISATTYYRLLDTCTLSATFGASSSVLVTVNSPSVTGSAGGSVCGLGTVSLTATGSGGTTLRWFDVLTGGAPLASGSPYTTPVINTTTTYYVEAVAGLTTSSVGPVSPAAQGGSITNGFVGMFNWRMSFEVIQTATLLSVDIFPEVSGEAGTIGVYNSIGTLLASQAYTTAVSGGATAQTITFAAPPTIPVGTGYYIRALVNVPTNGLTRNGSGSTFPYTSSAINITGTDLGPTSYAYYYNWQFSSGCASARTAVVATVSSPPGFTAPIAAPVAVCEGASSNLTSLDADYSTYSWLPTAGLSNPGIANPVATPSSTTTYTVTVSNGVCATSADVTVTVNPTPTALTISPAGSISFCVGAPAQLLTTSGGSGDLFRERFNAFPISKFTITGSGVTENQSTTYYQDPASSVRLTYDDDVTSINPGSYEMANAINMSLYSNSVLTFYHIAGVEPGFDYGFVEYSTDGGTSWVPFPTSSYSGSGSLQNGVVSFDPNSYPDWDAQFPPFSSGSTPGAGPAASLWKLETINLAPWQTETNFKVRFRVQSDGSLIYYGWLIDDVKINSQATITWAPITDLFTDAAGTIGYVGGTPAPSIYTKPTANRLYTATAAFGTCPATANVTVNYTSNPISLTIASAQGTINICGADTVDLSITAQNSQSAPTVVYDWRKNGTTITGSATANATSAGTSIVNVVSTATLFPGMAVQVSAGPGLFPANTRILNILSATQFTSSNNVSIAIGAGSTISATASGQSVTTLRYSDLANGDVITCVMTVAGVSCVPTNPVTSNSLTFTILPTTPTSVSILAAANPICATTSVTFTATPVNGGATPTYEWFVNSISQGAPSTTNTFTTSSLTNGQVVNCRMVSNAVNCPFPKAPFSNNISMTVNPSFPVSVSITSIPAPVVDTIKICSGTSVTFTATPTNGGATPTYQWLLNGLPAPGGINSPTYVTTTLADLDSVSVELTSSLPSCALNNPDTSNLIYVSVTTQVASVTISPLPNDTTCTGVSVTYTATPTNGGATPTYQWYRNGIPTVITSTYTVTPNDGDIIDVEMSSSLSCATPIPATASLTQKVNAAPSAGITGTSTVYCPGIPVVLNSNAVAGSGTISSIQWRRNYAIIGGATNPTYDATNFGLYKVTITNSNGCTDTSSAAFNITDGSGPLNGIYYIGRINAANVTGSTTTLTATSTANLVVGAVLTKISGGGTFAANTVVTSIVNGTTFTVNNAPSVALAAAVIGGADCDDYLSFATTISDLNTRTMGGVGGCTFNVQPGYVENLTAKLPALGAGGLLNATAATRTLTFQKNGVGANPRIIAYTGGTGTPATAAPDGIFTISGTDNITIDGIDLSENVSNAGNALMEYGYGLFKFAAGDGVQNTTIKNCVITLNRANNTAATGAGNPMMDGSVGILAVNATATAATTPVTPTNSVGVNTNGTNSTNKFYTNTIQNCNIGIGLSGYAAVAGVGPSPTATTFLGDLSNDVGGAVLANGNTILNFGGGGATAAAGIRALNQWSVNVSYNVINNNNGSGSSPAGVLRGIYGQGGTSASATISNNSITTNGGAVTAAITGIENGIGATALANTVSINNNTVSGTITSTTAAWIGITNSALAGIVNLNTNTVQNVSFAGAGAFTGISNTAAVTGTLNINSNTVTGNSKAAGAAMTLIAGGSPTATATTSISSNVITNNTMVGGGAAATMLGITMAGTSTYSANSNTVNNNSVTGMTGAAIATLSGFSNAGGTQNETISGNTFSNLFVTGTSTGLQIVRAIHNNTTGTSTRNVNTNTIFNLYTSSAVSAVVTGINSQLGGNTTISRNWIYNLFPGQSATVGSVAKGIGISSGGATTTNTVSNNMIAIDLTLAASATSSVAANSVLTGANSVIGIEMTSLVANSNIALFFNSIRLAGNGGTGFGSTAVFHTASLTATNAALTMTNNILDNECTPNGGLAVAFRRNSGIAGALANYASGNNNLFYAGTPGASNLIYSDGTSTAQTITAYITGVFTAGTIAPRESASLSDIPNFLSQTDLHLNAADNCALNGTGVAIAISIDYDNTLRNSPPDIGADEFAGVGAFGTWAGVNTNWNDPVNWCGGVPTAATSVIIPSPVPNYPVIPTGTTALALNVTVDAGANITTTGTGLLDIKGSVTNNGVLNNWGEIRLSGTVAQQFPTVASTGSINAMTRLTINNTAGVSINKDLLIREAITPTAGAVTLNNSYITLRSVVDSTARIGVVGGSFTYTGTGNFVVERYFPGRRAWRLITAPIVSTSAQSIFSSWQAGGNNSLANGGNGTFVSGPSPTGATGNGLDVSGTNNPSIKRFDPATSGFSAAFSGVGNTRSAKISYLPAAGNVNYTDTTGYFVFVRGDRTTNNPQPFNPFIVGNMTTLRDTGIVRNGSVVFNCNPTTVTHLYTLIGNPYASPVNFTSLTRNNVNNKFQVWDPTLGSVGGWAVWNGGVITPGGTVLTNSIIQSKQAFVVETNGAAPTVTFTEAAKSGTYNANMFRPAPLPAASLNVNLYFENSDGTDQLADGTLAKFNDEYSNASDYMDAVKFTNINETFCIKNGANYFIQDFRPFPTVADTIVFNFARAREFKYKFKISIDNIIRDRRRVAYLHDKFLGTTTPLNMQGETWVNFEVNSNAASSAANRFYITFKKVAKFNSIAADVLYSSAIVNWSVENAALVSHYEIERSDDGKSFEKVGEVAAKDDADGVSYYTLTDPGLATGEYYYRVKAISNSYAAMDYSEVAKVKVMTEKGGLYVYPNPVTDGIIGLKMNAASIEGKYTVRLLNGAGQAVAVHQFQHAKATQAHFISYPSYVASGTYQLEVTGPDKKKVMIGVAIAKK